VDDVTIRQGATLTVEPGVVVKGNHPNRTLSVAGHLQAVGSADNPIEFTATTTEPGNWYGIHFNGGTGHLKHTTLRYGRGSGNINVGGVADGGQVVIEDSQILDSTSYGIRVAPSELDQAIIVNNTFSGNTPGNGVAIKQGTINSDATLKPQLEGSYFLVDDVTIRQGATLTVEPGVVVKGNHPNRTLSVAGHLQAVGSADKPIEFTATTTEPGNWNGIHFNGGTGHLKHTTLRYGYNNGNINVANIPDEGQVLIENSLIEQGSGDGLRVGNGQVTIDCSTIMNNTGDGMQFFGNSTSSLSIARSSINSNGAQGLNNDSSVEIDARNTWWGNANGPGWGWTRLRG